MFSGVTQGDKFAIADELGKREACSPAQCPDRLIARPLQLLGNRRQFAAIGQIPQIRATMSSTSLEPTPPQQCLEKRGGSKMLNRTPSTLPFLIRRSSELSPSTRAM
jgi:hypothetical protein